MNNYLYLNKFKVIRFITHIRININIIKRIKNMKKLKYFIAALFAGAVMFVPASANAHHAKFKKDVRVKTYSYNTVVYCHRYPLSYRCEPLRIYFSFGNSHKFNNRTRRNFRSNRHIDKFDNRRHQRSRPTTSTRRFRK